MNQRRLKMRSAKAIVWGMLLSVGCAAMGKSAQDTWVDLVGAKGAKKAAFAYVENDPKLPNVLLYGDSISIAYTEQVRKRLDGKANVYRIHCNGGDSASMIRKLRAMNETMRDPAVIGRWNFEWDVIHFNVGLHDLKYVTDSGKYDVKTGKQVASLEMYEANLRAIVASLQATAPKAKLIWATTTPVPEGGQGRVGGDAAKYNAVAAKVMKAFPEVRVNDLFGFTHPHLAEWIVAPGNVHFKKDACAAQGDEVVRHLKAVLK